MTSKKHAQHVKILWGGEDVEEIEGLIHSNQDSKYLFRKCILDTTYLFILTRNDMEWQIEAKATKTLNLKKRLMG